ncbi:hypothetical protein M409DRAFT_65307 [Zasmidium cellare ATCC 36951]|uniref:Acyl-CoA dehydrogenase/oxidase C-terminal domain-containing protein n=1 Tax=Zasmidium cellare ATCC 36951 TaxID=1080233 RepID=A0A6A6CT10_ZASCE|nr:uncharacterized protein M409DRAFT_65307 [Zasmidium cellare ATCC 36951]KAF2168972.1 hypothetical protein M409DRAFT_65307 [Zasmidium cellare ATCC 36951]
MGPDPKRQPSSATTGFFQQQPAPSDLFNEDEALQRIFRFHLPLRTQHSIKPDLQHMSKLVTTPQILAWNADAERNTPYVRTWDSWGKRIDQLITSEGWRELQNLGIREGIVAIGHEKEFGRFGRFGRVYQFLKYHVWCAFSADVTCPSAMTDGAARLLRGQLEKGGLGEVERRVFERAFERLVQRDPGEAWTSGQWMTERAGGSDVRSTETLATPASNEDIRATDVDGNPLGPHSISGFKWFSSATDANATVLLAKEPDGSISAFFAPTRVLRPNSTTPELNGISIQRLKSKLGTRALPTAELVLSNMRAWRIGAAGQGTKEISTILNITRVHNAVSAVSSWGRGLSISRAFARVRRIRGKLLMDIPAHVRTLAEQHVLYHANMHLAFYTVALLGAAEHPSTPTSDTHSSRLLPQASVRHLLRLLTPLTKLLTAKAAIAGLQECMESLGGVGYLENEDVSMNIARLYRGANVLAIWEGTTNVMVDDLVRVVKGSTGQVTLEALAGVVESVVVHWKKSGQDRWAKPVEEAWGEVRQKIEESSRAELAFDGRSVAKDLGWIVCALCLGEDALSDGSPAAFEVCSRWISSKGTGSDLSGRSYVRAARWDSIIVFGDEPVVVRTKI